MPDHTRPRRPCCHPPLPPARAPRRLSYASSKTAGLTWNVIGLLTVRMHPPGAAPVAQPHRKNPMVAPEDFAVNQMGPGPRRNCPTSTGLTTTTPRRKVFAVIQIDAFLAAYRPKFICLACLGAVTGRDEADVRATVNALLAERRAETEVAECLNCNAKAFVVRRRVQ